MLVNILRIDLQFDFRVLAVGVEGDVVEQVFHHRVEAARADAVRDAPSNLRLWHAQLKDLYLLQQRIGGLRPPTLALWGQQDRVFDASGAEALRSLLPQARIETLPGLGHLPMMEAPLAVSARYGQFLHEMNAKNR